MAVPRSSPHVDREAGIGDHDKKDEIARGRSQCGDFEKASSLFRENLTWSVNALGPRDPVTLGDQDLLSFNLHELGRYEEAEALDRRTLQVRRQDQGSRHADTLETQHNLAFNLFKLGRYKEAADLDRRTLKARENAQGLEDQESLSSRHNLAASLQELKLYGEAADLNHETLKVREKNCNKDNDDLIASRHNLATNLHGLAQYDNATKLLQQNLKVLRETRNTDDLQLVRNENSLTINLNALGRIRKTKEDRARDDWKRRESWNTETLHEPKVLEQKGAAELETDQERRAGNAGRDYAVTNRDRNNDNSPRHIRPRASSTAAAHGRKNEESAGTEIQRSRSIDFERRPKKEEPREEPQTSIRTQDSISTHLDISKNDGLANTPGPNLRHKRASSASEAVVPHSTPIVTPSAPFMIFPSQRRNVDQDQALLTIPVVKEHRSRAKPDQNLAKSWSSKETRGAPIIKTTRPTSAGPRLPPSSPGVIESEVKNSEQAARGLQRLQIRSLEHGTHDQPTTQDSHYVTQQPNQNVVDSPTIKPTKAPVVQDESNIYSSLCDAHGGVEDPYASKAADDWFQLLQMNSQALLDTYRKDRMRRVKIAILDTGIDRTHPGIEAQWHKRIKGVKSWINDEGGDRDSCGHGTHDASLLMKVAPEALIYMARVVKDSNSSLNPDNVADAIIHAAEEWGVDIITMSFGFPRRYTNIERAIDRASNKDIILFAAASNSGANRKIAFPASSSRVICINSADGGGARSRFNPPPQSTSHNFSVLGEAVSSAWPTGLGEGAEKRRTGTSTSTPIAAAIAALVLEFAKQPQLHISHNARLKTLEGMREIFLNMSEEKDGYSFLVPWKILDKKVGRHHVAFRISDILLKFFGAEDDPH